MINIEDKSMCIGCTACKNICPQNAINMIEDEEGFEYPQINKQLCVEYGLCKKVCPIINIKTEEPDLPKTYAVYNKNDKIRMQSSSGGVFTEIAKVILNNEGIVFGAIFDENFNVIHEEATNQKELEKLRGSKYVQSNLNDTFKRAKKYLESGKQVLFTGTPCQIEALYSYLRKDFENLYTQDLICHGVPSKNVWKKYLEYRKVQDKSSLKKVSFRNKEHKGWNQYQLFFQYVNHDVYINHNEDLYMKVFLSDIALRPSCYECKFKKKHRRADITLADFWGIDNIIPQMNDEKGTGLVFINTLKGEKLFNKIIYNVEYKPVDFELAIQYNKSMIQSADINKRNKDFYKDLTFEKNVNINKIQQREE